MEYKELIKWLHKAFQEVLNKNPKHDTLFIDIIFKKARRDFEIKNKSEECLKIIHEEWGENWDVITDFFGKETADKLDDAILTIYKDE